MQAKFPEFFEKPKVKKLWKRALFVPDTNVLLDIFRFSPDTSKDLVKILNHLKSQERLWIPYQFAHEYLQRLPSIRKNIRNNDKKRVAELDKLSQILVNALREFDDQTDFELGEQITEIENTFKSIKNGLKEHRKRHKERLDTDDLETVIDRLFVDSIGDPCEDERLAEIYAEGEWRYKLRRPPGFKDEGKPESRMYGDLIGWMQIIEHADSDESERPVILVTRDTNGDDWFYKPRLDGKTHGPRPELVKEMRDKAGVDFYIHETWEFIELANEYLELDAPIPETTIEEAKRPRKSSVMYDPLSGINNAAGLSLHIDRNKHIQQTLKDLYASVDHSKQIQQTLKDQYVPVDLRKQMQQTLKDLYAPVDLSKQIQQTMKDLYAPVDLSKQMRQTLKDLYAPVDLSKQIQQTLKDLYAPVDLSKQMRQTLKDLYAPVDLSKQIQQTMNDLQRQIDVNAPIRQARPSLKEIARNAREAGISSEKSVDTAERSREILSDEDDESTHCSDE